MICSFLLSLEYNENSPGGFIHNVRYSSMMEEQIYLLSEKEHKSQKELEFLRMVNELEQIKNKSSDYSVNTFLELVEKYRLEDQGLTLNNKSHDVFEKIFYQLKNKITIKIADRSTFLCDFYID